MIFNVPSLLCWGTEPILGCANLIMAPGFHCLWHGAHSMANHSPIWLHIFVGTHHTSNLSSQWWFQIDSPNASKGRCQPSQKYSNVAHIISWRLPAEVIIHSSSFFQRYIKKICSKHSCTIDLASGWLADSPHHALATPCKINIVPEHLPSQKKGKDHHPTIIFHVRLFNFGVISPQWPSYLTAIYRARKNVWT